MKQIGDGGKRIVKVIRGKVDGDGLITEIYNLVWLKSQQHGDGGLKIPETVILEQGFAKVWYSWSDDVMEMEKKLGKEIILSRLYTAWSARKSSQTVVAEFASQRTDPETGDSILRFEYFDVEGLQKFLQTRAHEVSGLLQRFVAPKPSCNVVLQATWSPHAMLCTSRRNIHLLTHTWVSPCERCCTFDGPPSLSSVGPVSPFVRHKVEKEIKLLVKNVEEHQKAQITGLVCFLKFDLEGHLHLLHCTSIRSTKEHESTSVVPLNLGVKFDTVVKRKDDDTIIFRYERKGQVDDLGLPKIDLTNITDKALDILAIDTKGMLYLPNSKKSQQKKHALQHTTASVISQDDESNLQDGNDMDQIPDNRKASMGLPAIAKVLPEEFVVLENFMEDVLYRSHWHFFGEMVQNASHNFMQTRGTDKQPPKPFEFVIPEPILAIIGYEGVEVLMYKYSAKEIPQKYNSNINGEVQQEMFLKIERPNASLLEIGTARDFVVERLSHGLPKYQGGIDWARIRDTKGPRRSTKWLKMMGATEAAMRNREDLKKKIGLKTVAELLMLHPVAPLSAGKPKVRSFKKFNNTNLEEEFFKGRRASNSGNSDRESEPASPSGKQQPADRFVQDSPQGFVYLKKGAGSPRKRRWKKGAWKLEAVFPIPPKLRRPQTARAPSPRHERRKSFKHVMTKAGFTGQEQLDFWCQ